MNLSARIAVVVAVGGGASFLASLGSDRLLGLRHSTDTTHPPHLRERVRNLESEYSFDTNSQGLRYREIPLEKPEGRRRVLVLGDSFVEGALVASEDTFSSLLERRWHGVDFINGGIAGGGPFEYRNLMSEAGRRYHPDAVMICIYANDVENTAAQYGRWSWGHRLARRLWPNTCRLINRLRRARRQQKQPPSKWLELVEQRARSSAIPEERIREWRSALPERLIQAGFEGRFNAGILANGLLKPDYWTISLDIATPDAQARWAAMAEALEDIMDECRRESIPAALVFFPVVFQYDPAAHESRYPMIQAGHIVRRSWLTEETELQVRLAAWTKKHQVPYLDITEELRKAVKRGRQMNFKFDHHWTSEGHRVTAGAVGRWLNEQADFTFLSFKKNQF